MQRSVAERSAGITSDDELAVRVYAYEYVYVCVCDVRI